MSPHATVTKWTEYRFPRVSGDEPSYRGNDATQQEFSPRERG